MEVILALFLTPHFYRKISSMHNFFGNSARIARASEGPNLAEKPPRTLHELRTKLKLRKPNVERTTREGHLTVL